MMRFVTLEQAHKSGRQFRKVGTQAWTTLKEVGQINGEEAFANIWEVKAKESFSRSEVERIVRRTINELNHKTNSLDSLHKVELIMKVIAQED